MDSSYLLYKNKISKGMGILLKARKVLKKKVLLQLYYSFVFPYLIYCSEIWGCASDTHLQPLIKLQKKIIRIITFSPYCSHTQILFQQLDILPFKKLVIHRLGLQMHKYEHGNLPEALHLLFVKNSSVHNYNTRNKGKLRPAMAKHAYRDKDFRFICVHVWNHICEHIKTDTSSSAFKKTLKKYILSDNFEFGLL